MAVFLVERYLVGWAPEEIRCLVGRMASSDDQLGGEGVRHVRSLILAEEETCLCVFDGPDIDAVRRANDRAGLPFDRVVPGELYEHASARWPDGTRQSVE